MRPVGETAQGASPAADGAHGRSSVSEGTGAGREAHPLPETLLRDGVDRYLEDDSTRRSSRKPWARRATPPVFCRCPRRLRSGGPRAHITWWKRHIRSTSRACACGILSITQWSEPATISRRRALKWCPIVLLQRRRSTRTLEDGGANGGSMGPCKSRMGFWLP